MKFAVLASGSGSNLQAIMEACSRGDIASTLGLVVSNKMDAYALKRAQNAQVPAIFLNPKDYPDRPSYDQAILDVLRQHDIDFIILAGYMRILSDHFIETYQGKILNIHPSLLPDFKGAHAIRDAFEAGVQETGVTVHFVIPELDAGPVIIQERVSVTPDDTLSTLEDKIHAVEHIIYPKAIALFEQNKVSLL